MLEESSNIFLKHSFQQPLVYNLSTEYALTRSIPILCRLQFAIRMSRNFKEQSLAYTNDRSCQLNVQTALCGVDSIFPTTEQGVATRE